MVIILFGIVKAKNVAVVVKWKEFFLVIFVFMNR